MKETHSKFPQTSVHLDQYWKLAAKNFKYFMVKKSGKDHAPKQLVAIDMQGKPLEVISYILPLEKVAGSKSEYAKSLAPAARKIGLPDDSIDEFETWIYTHA